MSKMTDDELHYALNGVGEQWSDAARIRLGAHIAALTAERDEALSLKATDARDHARELDAIRGRVKALEMGLESWKKEAEFQTERKTHFRSRLAALRQRAREVRDLLGESSDNATKAWRLLDLELSDTPSEMDGLRGEMAESPERICAHVGGGVECTTCAPPGDPEPTTAEAFEVVRGHMELLGFKPDGEALMSLSLLERRMGAMEQAARDVLGTGGVAGFDALRR